MLGLRSYHLRVMPKIDSKAEQMYVHIYCYLCIHIHTIYIYTYIDMYVNQGYINRGMCSHPEPTQDHVLTSAYVKHFCTVATNAVNIECLREKKLSLTSLQ